MKRRCLSRMDAELISLTHLRHTLLDGPKACLVVALLRTCLVAQLFSALCSSMDCIPPPLSVGFPRQKYWSGLPFPPSGDLPDPGIAPASPALVGGFFTTESFYSLGSHQLDVCKHSFIRESAVVKQYSFIHWLVCSFTQQIVFAHLQSARHAVGSGNTMFQATKAYFLGRLTNKYLHKTGMRARKKRETESGVENAGKCLLSFFTYMNTFFFFLSAVPLTHSLAKMLKSQLFCDSVDCSPPGSSVHGILEARILQWISISSSRGSSQPRD